MRVGVCGWGVEGDWIKNAVGMLLTIVVTDDCPICGIQFDELDFCSRPEVAQERKTKTLFGSGNI